MMGANYKSITSLTGIIGYSSVPDSNGDTGAYVIPQYGKAAHDRTGIQGQTTISTALRLK